jgi:DNA polymerase (family 10)
MHNIHLRQLAQRRGYKISEYGIFKEKTNKRIASREEEDIYKILGLSFIPPEIREDEGEIEAAMKDNLPELVELSHIKGDLHVHSEFSDGVLSLEQLVKFGKELNYQYLVVSDHSKSLGVANGLNEKQLLSQLKQIKRLNKKENNFKLLTGVEVDIKKDGSLDIAKEVLEKLDVVVAAIHSGFRSSKEELTNRVIRAINSSLVDIIAHPTGRLIGEREGYELDWDEIFKAARKKKVAMEINSFPQRLDLNGHLARRAKQAQVKLALGTDAHTADQLKMMRYGLAVARRGWLEKKDLINTFSYRRLIKYLGK